MEVESREAFKRATEILIVLLSDCLTSVGAPVEELQQEIAEAVKIVIDIYGESIFTINPGLLAAAMCVAIIKQKYDYMAPTVIKIVARALGVSDKALKKRVRKIEKLIQTQRESRSGPRQTSSWRR